MDVSVTQRLTSVPCVSVLRRCDCIVSQHNILSSGKIFQIQFLSFGQNWNATEMNAAVSSIWDLF